MLRKPSYEELESKVKSLEQEIAWRICEEQTLRKRLKNSQTGKTIPLDAPFEKDELEKIIDIPMIQRLMDHLYRLTAIPVGIIDLKGKVLVGTGWQDICTQFHRIHPQTLANCIESDCFLTQNVKEGEYLEYKCKNNLWDIVTPIMVGGKHVGNLFLGQFFYEDEIPDYAYFERQADRYGFDKEAYLEALKRVPRWSREKVKRMMEFYIQLVSMITRLSYSNLQLNSEISERKSAVKALQKSKERFRVLYEKTPVMLHSIDRNLEIVNVNDHWLQVLGYGHSEVTGRKSTDFFTRESRRHAQKQIFPEFLKKGFVKDVPFQMVKKNGEIIDVLLSASSEKDEKGNVLSSLTVIEDITERKKAEKKLQESRQQYRDLVETINDWVWEIDKDGVYTYASPKVRELLGYESEEVIGKTPFDLMQEQEKIRCWNFFQDVLKKREPFSNLENTNRHKDGHLVVLETSGVPFFDQNHNLLGYRGVDRDITDRKQAEEKLKKREATLNSILTAAQVGIGSAQGEINRRIFQWVSDNLLKMVGYSAEELVGRDTRILYENDEEFKRVGEFVLRELRERGLGETETRWRRKDGSVLDVLVNCVLLGPEDISAGWCFTAMDITERKRAEKALAAREYEFRTLAESLPDNIVRYDREGRAIYINAVLEKTLGAAAAGRIGKRVREFYTDGSYETYAQFVDDALTRGENGEIEFIVPTPSKEPIVHQIRVIPERDEHGEVTGVLAIGRDITERKRADKAIKTALSQEKEAREKVEVIFNAVGEGLIFTDRDNRIELMSPSAEKMFGKSMKDNILQSVNAVLDDPALTGQLNDVLSGKKGDCLLELDCFSSREEENRIIQAHSSAVRDADGKISGVITLFRDISRERELDQIKSEFICTAAHELRTPLTAVKGFAEVLLNQKDLNTDQKAEFLSIIHEKSMLLEEIIGDLLDISRIEAGGQVSLTKSRSDIHSLLRETTGHYRRDYPDYRFKTVLPEQVLELWIDRKKIVQVLDNLVSNAMKFSARERLIKLVCEVANEEVIIIVEDEGLGMTPLQAERVFDKFYRADASDSGKEGLGLGMHVVKNIVEAHGGRIWLETEPGKGTKVFLTLPLVSPAQEPADGK